ncbi:hypothetical protein MYO4S_00155 [Serratia phage 4S]|nr:hypothetical protein MYO4S_00155 [Serratia phage 4S]
MKTILKLVDLKTVVNGHYVSRDVILRRHVEEITKRMSLIDDCYPTVESMSLWMNLARHRLLLTGYCPDEIAKLLQKALRKSGHASQSNWWSKLTRKKYDINKMIKYFFEYLNLAPSDIFLIEAKNMSYKEIEDIFIRMYQDQLVNRHKWSSK